MANKLTLTEQGRAALMQAIGNLYVTAQAHNTPVQVIVGTPRNNPELTPNQ